MLWLIVWVVSMVLAWWIGSTKSSAVGGLLLGTFLGPIGVIAAFALVDNKRMACPFCKELISKEAAKCPRCQSQLTAGWSTTSTTS